MKQGKEKKSGPVIGLFFGSFNPIHNGHVGIARYLLEKKLCAEVWFVVSPCNPFKVRSIPFAGDRAFRDREGCHQRNSRNESL